MNKVASVEVEQRDSSHSFKILINSEQSDYFKDWLHDPHIYVHQCSREELTELLESLLRCFKALNLSEIFPSNFPLWKSHPEEMEYCEDRLVGLHALTVAILVNLKIFNMKEEKMGGDVSMAEPGDVIQTEISERLCFEHRLHSPEAIKSAFDKICTANHHIDERFLSDLMIGKVQFCIPAVKQVVNACLKLCKKVEEAQVQYENRPQNDLRCKNFFYECNMLSKCFDFAYGAMLEDPNDILYQDKDSEDLQALAAVTEYHEPEDPAVILKKIDKAHRKLKYVIAIASKALMRSSKFCMFTDLCRYGMYYKCASGKRLAQANFTITVPNMVGMEKVFKMRDKISKKLPTVKTKLKTNHVFYIPIRHDDVIRADDLDSPETPNCMKSPDEWEIESGLKDYDNEQFIKVRLVTDLEFEWRNSDKKVDFEESLSSMNRNVQHVKAIVLDLHGGGFMFGTTNNQVNYTDVYCRGTGFPNFAVEYRLAPENKFPAALNDCWQTYLWLLTNAETVLGLKFDKILLSGNSAGANLALGITSLCIQKNVRIPDGLALTYPPMMFTLDSFSPSILLSLEDLQLNASYLYLIQRLYLPEGFEQFEHYVLSPKYLPHSFVKKFPPTRVAVGSLDPLRDEGIRFAAKLCKAGVDVKLLEYRYCVHGFLNHQKFPYKLKECEGSKEKVAEYLLELANYD